MGTLQARTPDPGAGNTLWHPETNSDREQLREQLNRLLSNSLFCHSKRYPNLLRYTVERAIEGHTDHLKERTLGIEVFGRTPDYDTNLDPVVRITAVEVRKRIAQYYREPGHETEIRIDFPAGSYLPEFRRPTAELIADHIDQGAVSVPAPILLQVPPASPGPLASTSRWTAIRIAGLGLIAAAVAGSLFVVRGHPNNVVDEFWGPLVSAPDAVLVCVGGLRPNNPPSANGPHELTVDELMRDDQVALSDATTMSLLTGLFKAKGKPFRIRRAATMVLADLREGPVVLIGAFNNPWSLRLIEPLRFHFQRFENFRRAILDRQNPTRTWAVDTAAAISAFPEDYAMVSRIQDPTTGRLVIMIGGITRYGTSAAGEFVTEPSYLRELVRLAPKDWNGKNFQVVLSTRVVGENSGPPHVLATHFW